MGNGGLLGTPVPGQQAGTPTAVPNPNVPVRTPMAGMSQIANALVNGYLDYQNQQQQNAPGAPMQLSGATSQPGLLSQLWNGFNQPAQDPTQSVASAPADPSSFGVY